MRYTLADIHVTECHAIVAYGDVTGFMSWLKRAKAAGQDVRIFIREMKFLFRRFRVETGYFGIPIGDGLIALIVEEPCPGDMQLLPMLESCLWLQRRMMSLISKTAYPRPTGFRIRVTAGIVYRTDEPPVKGPIVRTFDFLGDCMNLGARSLEIRRDITSLIHESALSRMSKYDQSKLHLRKIEARSDDRPPRGVEPEDMNGLWEFRMKRVSREKKNVGKIPFRKKTL